MQIFNIHFDSNNSNISPESLNKPAIILLFVKGALKREQTTLFFMLSELSLNDGWYPLTIFMNEEYGLFNLEKFW